MTTSQQRKPLGITVMPEYLQTEGIERVLDHLVHTAGVTAVTTSPYVMAPADESTGGREPPDDAGAGAVRLLDRPLWGKRELFVRTAPSFEPDVSLYAKQRYQPAPPNELTRSEGRVIADFVQAAQARHLKVYLQVQSAIPPGYRVQFGGPTDDDQPRLPYGDVPKRRLAKNGSLASPHIRGYLHALLRDLARAYPQIDGFRIDWPEYPPYFLDDVFLDFGEHARRAAERLGYDFTSMAAAAGELRTALLGGLTDELLAASIGVGGHHELLRGLSRRPRLADWLNFKADMVDELLTEVRATLDELPAKIDVRMGRKFELVPNAFAPPMTIASGFDFGRAVKHADAASTKLYTMHWPMIVHFWAKQLLEANPKLSERAVVAWLVRVLDIPTDGDEQATSIEPTMQHYAYPEPDRPHPVGLECQRRKIRQAQAEAGGKMPIFALVHGYGPPEDFGRRLAAAWQTADGVWINRYGYLSDEKLRIVGTVCQ